MQEQFSRTIRLIGNTAFERLQGATVMVVGLGGVGGYVVEGLARSGVCNFTLFDGDKIEESNLNRQIIATNLSIGQDKVEVAKNRILSINPNAVVTCHKVFYLKENADNYDLTNFDYIVDAIDTVSAKVEIIKRAKDLNIPIISCMGTAGKLCIEKLRVDCISKTSICPLARVMRKQLKDIGITELKVVYSVEEKKDFNLGEDSVGDGQKKAYPSMIFVPAAAGLMIAKEVILHLISQ